MSKMTTKDKILKIILLTEFTLCGIIVGLELMIKIFT